MSLRTTAALAALLVPLAASAADEKPTRPNVLFIAIDDLNDWIGSLGGHPQTKTPNLDRLAKRGVNFTKAYCSAPVCNPSRASLMSGLRPSTTGVYQNSQPWRPAMPDRVCLQQLFMAQGYDAVGSGKIYHEAYAEPENWTHYAKQHPDPKPSQQVLSDPHSHAGGIIWGKLDGVTDDQMNDYDIASDAIDYLGKPHDKPFFLACGLHRPHMPWQVPTKYYDMFPLDSIQTPEVPDDDLADVPPAGVRMAKPDGDHSNILKSDNWKQAVQAYLAAIAFADAQAGRLIDALDESEHAKNTIVILWGDHGWHLGEKHHWRKFTVWEEAARAPLMVTVPGMTKPESICERTVEFVHIYPTLVELCGLTPPDKLDGVSFVSLLKDPKAPWGRPAVTTYGRGNHGVRSERWRYIRYADGGEELYDHDADPNEWKNLASDSKYRGVMAELAAYLPRIDAPDAPHGRAGGKGDEGDGDASPPKRNRNNSRNRNRTSSE